MDHLRLPGTREGVEPVDRLRISGADLAGSTDLGNFQFSKFRPTPKRKPDEQIDGHAFASFPDAESCRRIAQAEEESS